MSLEGFEYIDDWNRIRENLFLGGHPNSVMTFKYVFAMNGRPTYHVPIGTMVICRPFDDAPYMPPEEMLHDIAQMILKYSRQGPTLVHCAAGINRSALVLALALVHDGMTPEDAIKLIREKRSDLCLSNKTFEQWLLNLKDLPDAAPSTDN